MEEDLIKKMAVSAGKKRISPQTGLIHYWRDDPYNPRQDTIPILENFIYAYALFRTKTVEHIQEGKALLEKLFALECEGNFPVYFHEFPKCVDSRLPSQVFPILTYLLKDYSIALGESWTRKIRALLQKMTPFLNSQEMQLPKSPEDWAKRCIELQMNDEPFPEDKILWNSTLGVFVGECHQRWQEGYEPAVTLFDLFMDKCGKRALSLDSPVHLKAALVQPWKKQAPKGAEDPFVALIDEKQRQCLTLYWGSLERVHSLVLEAKKGRWTIEEFSNEWLCTYTYDQQVPSEEDAVEWALYLDDSSDHTILVSNQKATMFHPDDVVTIKSQEVVVSFQVQVDTSQGTWTGHISKGDRSFQKSRSLPYGGYDWKMGWRTLQRKSDAKLTISIKVQKD